MPLKTAHFSASYIQQKHSPIFHKRTSLPTFNLPFNFNSEPCSQIPLSFRIFNYPTRPNFCKLRCIGSSFELSSGGHDPDSEITISKGNNHHIQSENLEIGKQVGGELADQNLWEQMAEILKFCGPATGIWICGPLMSLIDTAVIGQSSSLELAALGPGTVFCDGTSYVFMFLSIATSNMVAASLARQDENQVQHQISILLFVAVVSGVLMLLLTKLFGARALTAFVGQKNVQLVPAADSYIQIRALAWPAILVGSVAQSASLGMKDSVGPLKALLIASAINGIGDIVLCTFLGYGIAGAAWATAASQVVAAYTMTEALNKKGYNSFSFSVPSLKELQRILSIAAPVFITMVSKVAFYSLLTYFATSMGTNMVAAHQVLFQLYIMSSVWGEPLCQTAQSFMPELLYGVNRSLIKARALLKSLLIIGGFVGISSGIVGTCVLRLFPTCFTADAAVIREMQTVCIYFFLALCVTPCTLPCEGTLLAGRDFKFISLSMAGCFGLGALVSLLGRNQGLGLVGCWSAVVGFHLARFVISLLRLLLPSGVLYAEKLKADWL